jgi:hypothetical protein
MPKRRKRVSAKDNSKKPAKAPLQGCEDSLSPEERARVDQFFERAKNNPTGPRLKVTGNTIALNSVGTAIGASTRDREHRIPQRLH